jgi:Domain of unknown function (DUF4124)
MARFTYLTIGVILAFAIAGPAAAQWKWKDKDGRMQYSDVPPPSGVRDADILQRPSAARRLANAPAAPAAASAASESDSTAATPAANKVDPELEARRKKTQELELAKKKEEEQKIAAAHKENCASARNYMKTLDEGIRVSRINASGEREVLDDAGRQAEAKRAQAAINNNCK